MKRRHTLILSAVLFVLANNSVVFSQEKDESAYPMVPQFLSEFKFTELEGVARTLGEFKGKVVLVNIWAVWCGPCRPQIPKLVEMQKQYSEFGFEVVGLNLGNYDGKPEKNRDIRKFVDDFKINYTVLRSPREGTAAYYKLTQQHVVPQILLIDREGRIRGIFVGGGHRVDEAMQKAVASVVKEIEIKQK